ncbi:dethiobiotin synthetase [Syntrophotalea carbinolica DSM 2380]|uniref:ATP-dependent dethiobiotin synthetase BioD n=1 Tax=Syntrophotalea carbinolica (strain DSM 2380 / NBRC 103641 / GraBd1) TaxID=338963 RepID=Q3A4K2_SYNC1|nr:dethiobiotin synthase [Syntrophotalea carbinolica]ABA88705.1 dethiobiotin synthetase [Syntrophotalea carbinolica DSM 2380]
MNAAELAHIGGLIVTGTDTGVGKTLVGASLAYLLARKGCKVGVTKPLESGIPEPSCLGEDGALLRWASRSDDADDVICPYRLKEPLAPSLAARREGVHIDWSHVLDVIRCKHARSDFSLVEGAGGLLVPLAGKRLVADLAGDLGWPLLVVARAGLGTINHTLLTLESARARGLQVAGWVVSGVPAAADVAERHAAEEIARLTDVPCWGVLPQVAGSPHDKVASLASLMDAWPILRELGLPVKDD